jgi:hypothetical protein
MDKVLTEPLLLEFLVNRKIGGFGINGIKIETIL